jgi:hypothetical protein
MGTTARETSRLRAVIRHMVSETTARPHKDERDADQADRDVLLRFTRQARRALSGVAFGWTPPRVDRDPGAYWKVSCAIVPVQAAEAARALLGLGLKKSWGGRGTTHFEGAPDGIDVQLMAWKTGARLTFSKSTRLPN